MLVSVITGVVIVLFGHPILNLLLTLLQAAIKQRIVDVWLYLMIAWDQCW